MNNNSHHGSIRAVALRRRMNAERERLQKLSKLKNNPNSKRWSWRLMGKFVSAVMVRETRDAACESQQILNECQDRLRSLGIR